jgi:hypothetical protein
VPPDLDGEHDVLKFWGSARIFDRLRAKNRGKKPWSFVDGDALPKDFAKIPEENPKSNVLATVPGTPAAQEAVIAEVADAVNALGPEAKRADFLQLAIKYTGDEQRLQALVGLVRPVFDYGFFEEMTAYISKAPAGERSQLESLRDMLVQLTSLVDQQAQAALQEAVGLLRVIISSPNPDEVIQANLPMIDSTFLQVLSANIQEVTKRGDINASAKLKDIYNRIVAALQASMPPELQFINQLLNAPNDDEVRSMIAEHAGEFGQPLLGAIDAVEQQLAGQGDPAVMQRFELVRREATQALA